MVEENTLIRMWESNSRRIRSSLRDATGIPAAAALAESPSRAIACLSRLTAVVATLAPATNFRNRRLLVRRFFTLLWPHSWRDYRTLRQTKIYENPYGQKGLLTRVLDFP